LNNRAKPRSFIERKIELFLPSGAVNRMPWTERMDD